MPFRPLPLKLILVAVGTATTIGLMLLLTWSVEKASSRSLTAQIGETMAVLAGQLQDKIDRTVVERHRDLTEIAESLGEGIPAEGQAALDNLEQSLHSNPAFEWLGILDLNMQLIASRGNSGLAGSAPRSPLVQHILSRHAPVALVTRLLPPAAATGGDHEAAPWRLELVTPVRDRAGSLQAVVVAVAGWDWLHAIGQSLQHTRLEYKDAGLLVLTKDGIIFSNATGDAKDAAVDLNTPSIKEDDNGWFIETDQSGEKYVTGFSHAKAERYFGNPGLVVLVRRNQKAAFAPLQELNQSIFVYILLFGAHAALFHWVIASSVAAPFLQIARAADRLRQSNDTKIPHLMQFAEAKTLSESLISMVGDLKEQSRLLATASHDLRQPLHAMILYNYALKRRVSGTDAAKLADQIENSLTSLKSMLDELLHVARLDSGLVSRTLVPVRLKDVIERVAEEFSYEADRIGLKFDFTCADCYVLTDAALFETIVRNIVANALKFTRTGGILLAARRRGQNVLVEVYDTGPGIEEARLNTIFNEFERSANQAGGTNEGLGLGLSIVKRHAKLIDAEISVRSVVGRGSRFSISVKKAEKPAQDTDLTAHRRADLAIPGLRLMVLDDNPKVLEAVRLDLSDRGADVVTFTTATEAAHAINAGLAIDIAVIDYDLGGDITGIEFIRQRWREGKALEAMILTGRTDALTLSDIRSCGIPWMSKPVDPEALAAKIANLCQTATATNQSVKQI